MLYRKAEHSKTNTQDFKHRSTIAGAQQRLLSSYSSTATNTHSKLNRYSRSIVLSEINHYLSAFLKKLNLYIIFYYFLLFYNSFIIIFFLPWLNKSSSSLGGGLLASYPATPRAPPAQDTIFL